MKILVDGTLLIPNLIPEDAGNYTCIPANGILIPPSASAHLTVKRKGLISYERQLLCVSIHLCFVIDSFPSDPARVGRMSRETYLPAGMEGVIVCPVQADPPVLYVNWTKDGNDLNLDNVSYAIKKYNVLCKLQITVHNFVLFDLSSTQVG